MYLVIHVEIWHLKINRQRRYKYGVSSKCMQKIWVVCDDERAKKSYLYDRNPVKKIIYKIMRDMWYYFENSKQKWCLTQHGINVISAKEKK
jgi:hypothetical protein